MPTITTMRNYKFIGIVTILILFKIGIEGQTKKAIQRIVLSIDVCTVSILSGGWDGGYNLTQYSYIDDVRIAPTDAQVTSYTWEPGVGITSQTDPLGLTTTYEYDGLGRLIRVRDSEGKVVQEHRYKYATEQ